MLFSVLALLLVVAVVMKLAATQLQAVKPLAPATSASPRVDPARQAADAVGRALEQGAAQRAADAASQ